jgi:hypothetical protein
MLTRRQNQLEDGLQDLGLQDISLDPGYSERTWNANKYSVQFNDPIGIHDAEEVNRLQYARRPA